MEIENQIIDGRYKIIEQIGKGGMSVVYKAISINFNKVWAIKEVNLNSNTPIDFLAEPNMLKDLDHQALPRIVDIIYEKDKLFIVLDYIDGTSLNTFLDQSLTIGEERILSWAKDLCNVLIYLHNQENPIIYRDMKPGNIMLTRDGKIKLIDFGIARQYKENSTVDTVVIGTRGYAAPEQYGNKQTDARTDIYSLGVTLYHLATGKGPNDPPYELKPIREINHKLSEGLEHIISKCTKQDPKQRYQKVEELLDDLNNIDKLSYDYKTKQRRKKGKYFIALFILSTCIASFGEYKIVSAKKVDYLASVQKAQLYNEEGDKDTAIKILNKDINDMPNRTEAYFKIADIYMSNAEYSKAITYLKIEAVDKNKSISEEQEYSYLLGLACFNKSDYKGAIKYFENVTSSNFDGLEYYKVISKALSDPSKLSKDDKIVKNMTDFKSYIDKLEDDNRKSQGYLILSDIYRYNPSVFKNADDMEIQLLEDAKSIRGEQGNVAVYDRLGQAYYLKSLMIMNDDNQSNAYLNKALENYNIELKLGYSSSNTYKSIGVIYKNLNNYDMAKNYFELLVKNYPNDFKGYIELAKLYYQIEVRKDPKDRDYSKFIENYKLAEKNNDVDNNFELEKVKVLYNEVTK